MILLHLLLTASAADIHVGPGLAHQTLAEGISAARNGDTVYLMPGTHSISDVVVQKDLHITGLGGWADTILRVDQAIDGLEIVGANVTMSHLTFQMDGSSRGVYARSGSETVFQHVRFHNGGGSSGGCAWIIGDSQMRDVVFDGCDAGFDSGGALFYQGGTLSLDGSRFTDNQAFNGAGLRCTATCEVSRSLFDENTSRSGGGAISISGSLEVRASRLCGNDAGNGGGIWINQGVVDIENSVVWDNTAVNGGAIFVEDTFESVGDVSSRHNVWGYNTGGSTILSGDYDDLTFTNEIIVHNSALFAAERVADDSTWTFDTFIDFNNPNGILGASTGGNPFTIQGRISANPLLANNSRSACAPGDFTLGAGSPAIDAGTDVDVDGTIGDLGPFGGANPWVDADNDGVFAPEDCDDDDPAVHPGATETCNGVDDDCDGSIDGGSLPTQNYWSDGDGDGIGGGDPIALCAAAPGLVSRGGDCDDADPTVHPDANELCDGLDQDCDGILDNGLTQRDVYLDEDGDGYGDGTAIRACAAPDGYAVQAGDCDDNDRRFNPGASESDCTDPTDYNCDGSTGYADEDRDGFAACEECDDSDSGVNPNANETCDGVDQDCDGVVDNDAIDAVELARDEDRDGFGDARIIDTQCPGTSGWVDDRSDCDDSDASINPSQDDLPDNGVDEDCNGVDAVSTIPDDEAGSGCTMVGGSAAWLLVMLPLVAIRRRRAEERVE